MAAEMTKEEILSVVERAGVHIGSREVFSGDSPRFVVFHSGFSVCSEKVRTILNATGLPYVSHCVSLLEPYS